MANHIEMVDKLLRGLYDEVEAEVEKEVYGLTAERGRDMKAKVDRLEVEVKQLRKENENPNSTLTASNDTHIYGLLDNLTELTATRKERKATKKAKAAKAAPSINDPGLEHLWIENENLRAAIDSDDATRRDVKVRVDRLEGEVESLHSVIKLKNDRLTWWRQTVDDRNRTIEKLEKRVEFLTSSPPETGSTKWECVGCGGEVWWRAGWGEEERRVGSRWRKKRSGII